MIAKRRIWFARLALGLLMTPVMLCRAEVLQVKGAVSGWNSAAIVGVIDTSGASVNAVDVQITSLDPIIPESWFAFQVVRPLIWIGAVRVGDAVNYWDAWGSNYEGGIWDFGPFVYYHVKTAGTATTYLVDWKCPPYALPADVVAVESFNVYWTFYALRGEPGGTGCYGTAVFQLGPGAGYWEERLYELMSPQPGPLEGGEGHLTWSWIREVAPDVWRFSWTAVVPEPTAFLLLSAGIMVLVRAPRSRAL